VANRMFYAILFATFYFGLTATQGTNKIKPGSCGQTQVSNKVPGKQRIVNGYEARPHSVPWVISLRTKDNYHYGGAVLIRASNNAEESDIILTAQHCVAGYNGDVKVVAGAHYKSRQVPGEVTVGIADVVWHPNGNSDFAIAKLTKPIKFTQNIQPVCLPEMNEALPNGTAGIAAGWGGVAKSQGKADEVLQQVVMKIFDKWCDPNLWICNRQANQNLCFGDSGGPSFFKEGKNGYTLYGIAHAIGGTGCEGDDPIGYHVRVAIYVDWIREQIKKLTNVK